MFPSNVVANGEKISISTGYRAARDEYGGQTDMKVYEYVYQNGYLHSAVEEQITGSRHYGIRDGNEYKYDEKGNPIEDVMLSQEKLAMSYSMKNNYDGEDRLVTVDNYTFGSFECRETYSYDSMGRVDSVYWTLAGEEPYLRTVYLYDE